VQAVQLENLCMCRLSSENVSSPYDDRLDKTDPTGESNAVRRWACKFLTFYFSTSSILSLLSQIVNVKTYQTFCLFFCFFDVTRTFTTQCICVRVYFHVKWSHLTITMKRHGLHNFAGKEMQIKFVNFFQRSPRCTKIYLHFVYCKFSFGKCIRLSED
jgi:hypothetical protein